MTALAVMTPGLYLHGGLEGWRSTTGVMRAHAASLPLPLQAHPADASRLMEAIEAAHDEARTCFVRLGSYGLRVQCLVEIGPWRNGMAPVMVERLEPLAVSEWWLDDHTYAVSPAPPSTLLA